jgi:hypothetical protein
VGLEALYLIKMRCGEVWSPHASTLPQPSIAEFGDRIHMAAAPIPASRIPYQRASAALRGASFTHRFVGWVPLMALKPTEAGRRAALVHVDTVHRRGLGDSRPL